MRDNCGQCNLVFYLTYEDKNKTKKKHDYSKGCLNEDLERMCVFFSGLAMIV